MVRPIGYRFGVSGDEMLGSRWLARWVPRPRPWSLVATSGLLAAAVASWLEDHSLMAVASALAAIAWAWLGAVPRANRHNAARIAGMTAAATLAVTWATAMLGALLYATFAAHDTQARIWIPAMLLVATNMGGLLAVFRSAQTRTETSAALREMSDLRIAVLSGPVIEAADRASQARTLEELSASFRSMLQLAVNLSLLPRAVDQASLWAVDDERGEWFICAATAVRGQEAFRQRVVERETPGAGIVANFAAGASPPKLPATTHAEDVYLVGRGLREHPWYLVNPNHDHPAEGLAVVLLRVGGSPVGALCFTWEAQVVPVAGNLAKEMIDILHRWAQAFNIALSRLYRLREELRS